MDNLFDLRDKVAIVTGSSRGIGRAIAARLAQHGAKVVVSSRDQNAVDEAAAAIAAGGGETLGIAAHIGHKDQLEALVARTVEKWGGVDILVCNAAVNPYYGPLSGIGDEAYDRIQNSNVRSSLWLSNMVFPSMAQRGGGSAIYLSSIAGLKGSDALGAYAISKAALMQLARNLAIEWGPHGIRANCLAPGIIRTEFARALWDNPKIAEPTIATTPLRRLGEPDDVAGAAVFLASRAGAFVTGQSIVIDGGVTIAGGL